MNSLKDYVTIHLPVILNRCVGSCNTLNDLSNKVCFPNKTEDLDLSVFNMITEINDPKIWTNHISCNIFSKYYWRYSDYVWWNYKYNKNTCNKTITTSFNAER